MKIIKLFSSFILLLIVYTANAQTSQHAISFQGFFANNEREPMAEIPIDVKFTIYPESGVGYTYEEVQSLTTDPYGIFHTVIGKSSPTMFQRMNFTAKGVDFWMKVEIKETSTPDYTLLSNSKMQAVPYARYAYNGVPVGTIVSFGSGATNVPEGWLLCDGTQYDGTDSKYIQLYNVIENTWGGTTTNFNVPELRGFFLRGVDNGQGVDIDAASRTALIAGGNTGDMVGTYQIDKFKSHNHGISDPGHNHSYSDSYNNADVSDNANDRAIGSPSASSTTRTTSSSGSGISLGAEGGSDTRPKNVYVLYIIKY